MDADIQPDPGRWRSDLREYTINKESNRMLRRFPENIVSSFRVL